MKDKSNDDEAKRSKPDFVEETEEQANVRFLSPF